jgi:hypothetical protein
MSVSIFSWRLDAQSSGMVLIVGLFRTCKLAERAMSRSPWFSLPMYFDALDTANPGCSSLGPRR